MGPPRFDTAPASVLTHVGGHAILSASVEGTHPLSLQWFHDGLIEGAMGDHGPRMPAGTSPLLSPDVASTSRLTAPICTPTACRWTRPSSRLPLPPTTLN